MATLKNFHVVVERVNVTMATIGPYDSNKSKPKKDIDNGIELLRLNSVCGQRLDQLFSFETTMSTDKCIKKIFR